MLADFILQGCAIRSKNGKSKSDAFQSAFCPTRQTDFDKLQQQILHDQDALRREILELNAKIDEVLK